ncbi:protein of unknown function [Thauera humireducens]|nr:protein of unknown function [Thauera humireducens]
MALIVRNREIKHPEPCYPYCRCSLSKLVVVRHQPRCPADLRNREDLQVEFDLPPIFLAFTRECLADHETALKRGDCVEWSYLEDFLRRNEVKLFFACLNRKFRQNRRRNDESTARISGIPDQPSNPSVAQVIVTLREQRYQNVYVDDRRHSVSVADAVQRRF